MNITNVTDFDNMTDDDYNNTFSLIINCTNNENVIEIIIPTLLLSIPCGLSFLCLMRLMVYELFEPLFN